MDRVAWRSRPTPAQRILSSTAETPLFEEVLSKSQTFEGADRLMYVVGATRPEQLGRVRKLVPDAFLLVPGVGAQGGTVEDVCAHGMNATCGFLVNSSRGILYAGGQECHRGGSQARQPGRSRQVAGVDAHRIGEGQAGLSRA